MSKNPTPSDSDRDKQTVRELRNKLRATLEERDEARAERDKSRAEFDSLQKEFYEAQNDFIASQDKFSDLEDTNARFTQLENIVKESQKIARTVSIRLALLASSFGSFAWMLTLWVNRPADAGLLYDLTIAFFGVISVVFLLAAFKDELRNKFKSWFKRWRR